MTEETNPNKEENASPFATEADEINAMKGANADAEQNAGAAELQRKVEELTGDLQRERADFANFRKRVITEKAQQAAQSSARLLTDLLPALDALDQFFAAYLPKAEADASIKAIVDGVSLVQKQISRVFTEAGVEEFNPTGSEFDPNMMEALSMQEADVERETVVQVFQKGYRIEGKVIRPARVVVGKPRAKTDGEGLANS